MNRSNSFLAADFSHIYIEHDALKYKAAQDILRRFKKAEQVMIGDYKHVFARPRQDWRLQKQSMKLILAVKKKDFLYNGTPAAPDFGNANFFYNSLILNCIYDCHYCYLQGMYPSANIVIFVNTEDYFSKTRKTLAELGSMYLCISYDTDLLAFEGIVPYCREWILFTRDNPGLTIELRTKSANFKPIADLPPLERVILAWTLSPEDISRKYETSTPSLKARIAAAARAIDAGWQVRLCFDPVLMVSGWKQQYGELVDQVFSELPADRIRDVSFGPFRMNTDYYSRTRKARGDSGLIHTEYTRHNDTVSYSAAGTQELKSFLTERLAAKIDGEKIYFTAPQDSP